MPNPLSYIGQGGKNLLYGSLGDSRGDGLSPCGEGRTRMWRLKWLQPFYRRMSNQNEDKPVAGEQRQMNHREAGPAPNDTKNLYTPVS